MATTEKQSRIRNWFNGLRGEFKKIIWPDRNTLARQTVAVLAVSVVLGIIISLLDFIFQYAIDFLVSI